MKIKNKTEMVPYMEVAELIGELVLCNNIADIDESIYGNMEYNKDNYEEDVYPTIRQWFLCNLSEWEINYIKRVYPDVILSYSDKLDLDILCVNHSGTSWNCVETTKIIEE